MDWQAIGLKLIPSFTNIDFMFQLIFLGQNLMGETANIVGFRQMEAKTLELILITVGDVSETDAIFNLKINGTAQFSGAARPKIVAGQTTVIVSGLNIEIVQFDKVTVDLESGNAISPIEIGFKYAGDGEADTGLPDQTGHAGEFLTTDGNNPAWSAVGGGGGGGIVTDNYNQITWRKIVDNNNQIVNYDAINSDNEFINPSGVTFGASSVERIIGDGAFKTTLPGSMLYTYLYIGCCFVDTSQNYQTIRYGMVWWAYPNVDSGILNSGSYLQDMGIIAPGSVVEFIRTGTNLRLEVDGVEKYAWTDVPSRPLHFKAALADSTSSKCGVVYIKGEA